MNNAPNVFSKVETWFLGALLQNGNARVSDSLEMLTGEAVEKVKVQIKVIPGSEVLRSLDTIMGRLATVISNISGDLLGEFLFFQTEQDYRVLTELMSPTLIGISEEDKGDPASYLVPEWLKKQRRKHMAGNRGKHVMLDAISELANVLFGVYGTAVYDSANLAIFQAMPRATLDPHHDLLAEAVDRNVKTTNLAVLISIDFVITKKDLKIWLLMLLEKEGIQAMLDSRHRDQNQDSQISSDS
jgi:chemotaxis protein CheY-P-specific phosphatase CheC